MSLLNRCDVNSRPSNIIQVLIKYFLVKATMMGEKIDSEEDEEAMDLLVYNAQKLNEAVKDTVRAAESASIRVRSDAGFKLKWVRKPAWFNQQEE